MSGQTESIIDNPTFVFVLIRVCTKRIPYLLDQTPRLLFILSCNFERLLLEAVFIKLRGVATATDAEIKKPDPFVDIDKDENELEENKVVLEDC